MRKTCMLSAMLLAFWAASAFAVSVDIKDIGLTKGDGVDEVKRPEGIAADREGRLLLTDKDNKKLLLYTTDGKFKFAFPSRESKKLERPTACAIGPGGAFYVVDDDKKAVYRFNEAGERQSVGSKSLFPEPIAVAADDSGRVFVVDKKEKKLVALSASGDRLSGYNVAFDDPMAVAADRLGRAYVADADKGILFVFKPDGTIERELSLQTGAAKDGQLKKPVGVAVNTHGEIFIIDQNDRKVFYKQGVSDPNWQPLFGGEGDGQGEFKKPVAITVAGRDVVFVLDQDVPKISRATLTDLPGIPALGQSGLMITQDTMTVIPQVATSFNEPKVLISRVEQEKGRVYFSVLRPNGMPEGGLAANDLTFTLAERPIRNVRLQSFADDPDARLMVVLGFGVTKMIPLEVQRAKTAVVENFISDLIEAKPDKAAILTFNDKIEVPAMFTADPFRLKEELNKVGFTGKKLKFFDAILSGRDMIANTDSAGFGALVYLVDSRDQGSQFDLFRLEKEANEGNFPPVFVIGIGIKPGDQLADELAKVAQLTKGAYFFTEPVGEHYDKIYKHINRMLENQYVATFPGPLTSGPVGISYTRRDGTEISTSARLKGGTPPVPEDRKDLDATGTSTMKIVLIVVICLVVLILLIIIVMVLVKKSRAVPSGWSLEVRRGTGHGNRYSIKKSETKIGSGSSNDIVVRDDRVSKNHALLRWTGSRFEVEDLNSTNHTFVNGKRVSKAALRSGDMVSVANVSDLVLEGRE